MPRILQALIAALAMTAGAYSSPAQAAPKAAVTRPEPAVSHPQLHLNATTIVPIRVRAAEYASAHDRGCPYAWGGAGPCHVSGFDCSGLVMVAYLHAGVRLPHNVAMMVESGKLRWIPQRLARRGDLAVYGSGWGAFHVALVWHAWRSHVRWLFAASTWGHLSGSYPEAWFPPTAYYRVRP